MANPNELEDYFNPFGSGAPPADSGGSSSSSKPRRYGWQTPSAWQLWELKNAFPKVGEDELWDTHLNYDQAPDRKFFNQILNNARHYYLKNPPAAAPASAPAGSGGGSTSTPSNAYTGGWGGLQNYIGSLYAGLNPSGESLAQVYDKLLAAGVKVRRPTRGTGALSDDKLEFDEYGYGVDLIQDVGGPGAAWSWMPYSLSGGRGPTRHSDGSDPLRGGEFTDPFGAAFEDAVRRRLVELGVPPERASLNDFVDRLLGADRNKQARTDAFVGNLRDRIGQLKEPVYSTQEEAVLRAKSFDQLERRRQQTLKNRRDELYARGHAPTSGTIVGAENEVDTAFETARTGIESDLLMNAIDETQRRQDKALSLEGLIEQALSGADLQSLQFLAQAAEIEDALIQDRDSRSRESISTHMLPLELLETRRASARADVGLGGSPQSLAASILGLLGFGQQNRALDLQRSANNNAGLGSLFEILMPRERR